MLRATQILLFALLCAATLSAQPKWITMQNENFLVYSSANERDTRDLLNSLERVRGFFIQFTGATPAKPVPISVVIFGTEKEYQAYRFNEFAVAYYAGQSDRDFIVVGKLGEQSSQIATHEYTHLVFRHAGYNLPPWLNEGIADLFSTLRPLGGDTEFGNTLLGRLQALTRDSWVPMQTILAADQASPYYNESKKAGNLYNQSWALVHMLATRNEYRFKFWDLLKIVRDGTPSVQALEQLYGVPFAKLESELRSYVRGSSFNKLVVKLKLDGTEKLKGQSADMFEVREAQAELLMGLPGKQGEARARFEELTREDAKHNEPWANLGYLAWRDGKVADATENFAKAFELGNRSPRLLLDFSRLALRDKPESASAALTALLELEPQNFDARLTLANLQVSQRQYTAALATVRAVTSVKTAEQRDRVLYLRAFAAMQSGDLVEAKARAEELKRNSTADEYTSRADNMLRFLNQPQRPAQAPTEPRPIATAQVEFAPPATENDADLVRPTLRERESLPATRPATREDMEIILQDIRGTLVEMNCTTPARFILKTEAGLKSFLILQPDRLIVTGRVGGAEFACGAQQPASALRLQFTIAPEGSDADGVVRAVHF
jgi:Flp pilus assembly protein TadD